MDTMKSALVNFFGVAVRGQTYLNALYLLLSFPLGLFYFIFLVVGLSVGIPTIIIWVGLVVLLAVFAAWYAFLAFERQMAIGMLREDIPPMSNQDLTGMSLWQKFISAVKNPVTWKGLVYLFAKFPLGVFSFVVLVTLISVSVAFVATPFYYQYFPPSVDLTWNGAYYTNPAFLIDTLPEALIACLVGIFLTLISLHIFNGLAWVSGKFARVMLGNFSPVPVTASASAAASAVLTADAALASSPVEAELPAPAEPAEQPESDDKPAAE